MFGLDPGILTGLSAIVVSFITGFFAWRVGRRKSNVDYAGVIQKGFTSLITELQEQHAADQKDIRLCQEVVKDLSNKVSLLTTYIGRLEQFLRQHGLWNEAPKVDLKGFPRNGHK